LFITFVNPNQIQQEKRRNRRNTWGIGVDSVMDQVKLLTVWVKGKPYIVLPLVLADLEKILVRKCVVKTALFAHLFCSQILVARLAQI